MTLRVAASFFDKIHDKAPLKGLKTGRRKHTYPTVCVDVVTKFKVSTLLTNSHTFPSMLALRI